MRYWAFMNGEVPGSFTAEELAALPGFTMTTLVCPAQGEIAEKNWRRAGEFGDIARAVEAQARRTPPPAPASDAAAAAAAGAAGAGVNVDAMIDSASTKLFSHVADLMKELESRREEKALIVSLQRQIAALKEELVATRERASMSEMRLPRIAELEETQRKNVAAIESLQTTMVQREHALNDARVAAERYKNELEAAKRRLAETANDLVLRNRLVDKLSKDLSEKEISLAKSLGVIRRLEEDLNRLCPDPALLAASAGVSLPRASVPAPAPAPMPAPAPAAAAPAPEAAASAAPPEPPPLTGPAIPPAPEPIATLPTDASAGATLPPSPYTVDDPPPTPAYIEPPAPAEGSKAQQALMGFLKKIFPTGQHH